MEFPQQAALGSRQVYEVFSYYDPASSAVTFAARHQNGETLPEHLLYYRAFMLSLHQVPKLEKVMREEVGEKQTPDPRALDQQLATSFGEEPLFPPHSVPINRTDH